MNGMNIPYHSQNEKTSLEQRKGGNFSIGEIVFPFWVGAAPLAGFSHRAYRDWLRKWGAGFVISEMVSVEGLFREDRKSWKLLDIEGEMQPWVQLFGKHEPAKWYTVARRIVDRFGIRLVDINFGCPVRKVVRIGAGSALLASPQAMADIVKALKDAGVLATAKVRLGIQGPLWEEFLPALEKAKVDALTVHGRYAYQFYSGQADWEQIAAIRQRYQGVLIGNGDIDSPEKAKERRENSGVDAVMIGRHAIAAPYIFRQIREYEETGKYSIVSPEEVKELLLEYADLYLRISGQTSLVPIRTTLLSMIRGIDYAKYLRQRLSEVKDYAELRGLVQGEERNEQEENVFHYFQKKNTKTDTLRTKTSAKISRYLTEDTFSDTIKE